MKTTSITTNLTAAAVAVAALMSAVPLQAAQPESRLYRVTQGGTVRVCQYPQYYSISYRNPATGQLEGLDVDLSKELAKELGVKLEIVESSFGTFIADLQSDKCDIGMFGVGATLKRAQAVEFSKPYLQSTIYAIVRKDGKIANWADIDKSGVNVVTTLGSYIEPFMRDYLKNATFNAIAPPATREGELMANRADVVMADYPTAIKVKDEFDWAKIIEPDVPLRVTPYCD